LAIEQFGFKKGDQFEVVKRKDGIILRKTEEGKRMVNDNGGI